MCMCVCLDTHPGEFYNLTVVGGTAISRTVHIFLSYADANPWVSTREW